MLTKKEELFVDNFKFDPNRTRMDKTQIKKKQFTLYESEIENILSKNNEKNKSFFQKAVYNYPRLSIKDSELFIQALKEKFGEEAEIRFYYGEDYWEFYIDVVLSENENDFRARLKAIEDMENKEKEDIRNNDYQKYLELKNKYGY